MRRVVGLVLCLGLCGCRAIFGTGYGAQYRAEYEDLKGEVLAAADAQGEAEALRKLGTWLGRHPYGYYLTTPGAETAGVNVAGMEPGTKVELHLYMQTDFEPRPWGDFTMEVKEPRNLLLLEPGRQSLWAKTFASK